MSGQNNKSEQDKRVSIKDRRKKSQGAALLDAMQENQSMLILFGIIVVSLAVILVSILVLNMPVVPVCVIVLLEAGLAVCLHDVPIWLHAVVVIAQIVVGILCSMTVFMILCAVLYVAGIFALRYAGTEK